MALFKIFKGPQNNLGTVASGTDAAHEGYAYFTTDNGKFYIDIIDAAAAEIGVNRIPLSADRADKDDLGNIIKNTYAASLNLTGHTLTLIAKDGTSVLSTITLPDNNTTYTFADGNDGSFTVTPYGGSAQTVSIGKPATAGTADVANSVEWSGITNKPDTFTPSSHSHGNITNSGDITATAPTIANGDQIVINDHSASKITNGPTFDGSTDTQYLSKKGTWVDVPTYSLTGAYGSSNTTWVSTLTPSSGSTTTSTVPSMVGATGSAAGKAGLVTKPAAGDQEKFLRGDGSWQNVTVTDTLVAQTAMTNSENAAYKLLTTSSASPTSGSAAEAKYSTNLTYNPNTDTLSAGHLTLSGNAYLNNKTYADDITTGSLLVNGSANFVQSPLAPTPTPGDSTQKLATTEFVHNAVSGLSGAMHFRGTTTSGVVDGSTTNPITINGNSYTATAGDVVLREITTGNIFEYVWTGSAWEMLGRDTSFKVQQDPITDSTGTLLENTTANQFIYSFSQNANGEVSVKTKSLAIASDSTLGGIKTNYSASGKNYAIKVDSSGNAYVNVPWANTTYTFNTTAQTNKIQYKATGASSWTDVPITISITNNITGSGSSGSLAKFNGNNTITSGPALANSISSQTQTTKFLREDGTWAAPSYTTNTNTTYTFTSGDGSFTVTPSGGSAQTVSIGTVPITNGGTGATTALAAITNLGGPSIASAGNQLTSNDNIDTLTSYGTYYVPTTLPTDGRPDGTEPHTAGYKLYYIKGYNGTNYNIQLAFSSGEIARMRMRSGSNTWGDWLNLVRSTAGSAVGSATNPVYVTSTGMITACNPTNELRVYDGDTPSANIGSTPIYIKTNIVLSTSESKTIIGTIRTGGYTYDGSSNIIPFNIYWNKTQLAFSNGSYTDLLGTSLSGITALAINETVDGITTTYLYLQIARSKTYITYAVNCQLGAQPQVNCAVSFTTENSVLGENNINVIASLALTRYATVTTSELTVNSLTASQAVSTNANKKLVSTDLTVSDPAASGTGITYIATISQSAVGKITATKSTIRSASTEQTGVLQFTAANTNTQLATLPNWTANPTDDTYLIRKDNGGTDVFGQVKFSTVWNYIKGKITSDVPNLYWADQDISSSASYNTQPEVATIKLNGNTSAAAASTNNVQLVYDSTLAVLNFVFS